MNFLLLSMMLLGMVQAEEVPAPKEISKTLDDGTVQGFSLQLTDDAVFSDFSIFQRPGSKESIATGAILYAIPADTGMPNTLHFIISPPAVVGEETIWNFKKQIAAAIKEERFPEVIPSETVLTLQFLRGRKGVAVGTPITLGDAPVDRKAPSRGKSGCRAGDCFNERFTECRTAQLESRNAIDLSYRYEILGPSEKGCRVRSTFLLHPNEDWAGKSMVCVYDAGKPFPESIQKPLSCTGALADAMRGN